VARIRSVKPEYWDDRKLAKRTSRDARLLYIALWNLADEWSRVNGDPQWIKGQVFSYDDDLDALAVAKLLDELADPAVGAVVPYEADGDPYLFLPKLARHQRLEPEKVRSRLPAPPDPDGCGPNPPPSERGADSSGSRADSPERGADEVARNADKVGRGADKPALLYVAGGREHVAGGRDARDAPPPRGTPTANHLLDEHIAACAAKPPRPVAAKVGEAIDVLLDDPDIKPDEVREGLRRLRAKPHLGPGVLASLVNEYRQELADPGIKQRASPHRAGNRRGGASDDLSSEVYGQGRTRI
jgi:hypothetical protein